MLRRIMVVMKLYLQHGLTLMLKRLGQLESCPVHRAASCPDGPTTLIALGSVNDFVDIEARLRVIGVWLPQRVRVSMRWTGLPTRPLPTSFAAPNR